MLKDQVSGVPTLHVHSGGGGVKHSGNILLSTCVRVLDGGQLHHLVGTTVYMSSAMFWGEEVLQHQNAPVWIHGFISSKNMG